MKNLKIAVVGAKGLVGRKMIDVLHERHFDAPSLFGTAADELETPYGVLPIAALTTEALMQAKPDYALMAVDAAVSRKIAPMLAALSITVIDNSTAFRMSENVPLIIPEVNAAAVVFSNGIIANPNCTTIQLLTAVAPLHKAYGIKQMIVNTYQAVSGAGSDALKKLKSGGEVDGYTLKDNVVAKIDDFCDNGYTKEEMKIKNETAKILSENIKVSATCVRVPVKYGHAVSQGQDAGNPARSPSERPTHQDHRACPEFRQGIGYDRRIPRGFGRRRRPHGCGPAGPAGTAFGLSPQVGGRL